MEDNVRTDIIGDFVNYAAEQLGIEQLPQVYLVADREFAVQNRSFGAYVPKTGQLTVYIGNRNLADVLRTLAHEMVHHRQNELGMLRPDSGETGSPQENEANSLAGELLRNYGKTNELIYEGKISKKDPTKYQFYCDMDGVLCDFDKQFQQNFGLLPKEFEEKNGVQAFHKAINSKGQEFWETMEWMPEGKALWNKIKDYEPIIVTSPGSYKGAKEGKLVWIQNNLQPAPKDVKFERAGHKQNVLEGKSEEEIKKSILIDDYDKNIRAWKQFGGKTIKEKPGKPAHNHIGD